MALWVILAAIAAAIVWVMWGKKRYHLYKLSRLPKVEGSKVEAGTIVGAADSFTTGTGDFFSRSTGHFNQAVG
jgi:ABC-type glucose/galactose transport system permease subunit